MAAMAHAGSTPQDPDTRTNPELLALQGEALLRGDPDLALALAARMEERVRRHRTGEMLDIYDDSLRHLGAKERGLVHLDGDWHRSFHCWLVSPVHRTVLVQRRSAAKATYPGALDTSVAGHYRAGEGVREGCRESEEELGLTLEPDRLIPLGRSVDAGRHGYLIDREVADVFLYVTDVRPDALTPDPAEVAEVLEVPVAGALALFTGERATCAASAWTPGAGAPRSATIRPEEFTGHHDRYYSRLFLQAQRVAVGLRPLAV